MSRLNIDDIPNVSDKVKQAVANINAGFDEAERRIDEAQRLADFVAGKPPSNMAHQHLGIVHGNANVIRTALERGEYIISKDEHKARRKFLDKHYESENLTRSIDSDGDVVITINVAK